VPPADLDHRVHVGEVDDLAHPCDLEPGRGRVAVDGHDPHAELVHALDRAALVPARADEEERPLGHGGDAMRVRRILVTGMSGTGKSSALAELARQGFRTVDTDEPGWKDGELWREDRIAELLDQEGETLIVSGCVENQGRFYDRFDAVVLLSAPAEVMLERIDARTNNPFGKSSAERARILADLAEFEPLLRAGCTHELDAARPLADVVADLAAIAGT